MPTAFTHGLVGGALAQAAPAGVPRWKLVLMLMIVAILPDADVIAFSLDIPYSHPLGHRGFSHSLLFALIVSLLVGLAVFRQPPRFTRPWWALVALTFLAGASHGLLDAATDAGLGIGFFIPFSEARIFYELRPIRTATVDPIAFFQRRSLGVLWSEVLWVWLPLLAVSAAYQLGRLLFRFRLKRRPVRGTHAP